MLSKKADGFILVNCGFYAVERNVQPEERPAMRTIATPMRESIFERNIAQERLWKETFDILCDSYNHLSPNFSIVHDDFGGYKLVYKGKNPVFPPSVLKKIPVGFVRQVPAGAVTDLSVMSSELTGQQFVLLGPIRFVNSDCSPNCHYDFSSDAGIVQLKAKRRINYGDELFVKYGPEFFELNACRCRSCNLKRREDDNIANAFSFLLEELINEIASESVTEIEEEQGERVPKRRRIRGRELVELYNEMSSAPLTVNPEYLSEDDRVSLEADDSSLDSDFPIICFLLPSLSTRTHYLTMQVLPMIRVQKNSPLQELSLTQAMQTTRWKLSQSPRTAKH